MANHTSSKISRVLRWLGERRDGFLVGGAVLYGLGYLVWSYNAWKNGLGQLPGLDFQYLIAGLVPAAVILLAGAAIRSFSRLQERTLSFLRRHPKLRRLSISTIAIIQVGLSLAMFAADKEWIPQTWLTKEELTKYTAPAVMLILYYMLLLQAPSRTNRSMRWMARLSDVYQYVIAAFFCWYSLVIYFDLYPRLPQELGGPEPRCAYADLRKDEISFQSLSALTKPGVETVSPEIEVIRSRKLMVYFAGGEHFLVRTSPDGASTSAEELRRAPLYELHKDVIRAVEWCSN